MSLLRRRVLYDLAIYPACCYCTVRQETKQVRACVRVCVCVCALSRRPHNDALNLGRSSPLVKWNVLIILCLHSLPSRIQFYYLSGMRALALQAKEAGRSNVAFLAFFVTGQVHNDSHKVPSLFLFAQFLRCTASMSINGGNKNDMLKRGWYDFFNVVTCMFCDILQVEECIQLLIDTGRVPEAAFMARTYMPSMISRYGTLWHALIYHILHMLMSIIPRCIAIIAFTNWQNERYIIQAWDIILECMRSPSPVLLQSSFFFFFSPNWASSDIHFPGLPFHLSI